MNILEINEENIISENSIKLLGNDIQFGNIKLNKSKHFVGIRSEHLKSNQKNQFTFNPEIELIENLGNEKIVYMKYYEHQLSAKIPSSEEISNTVGFEFKDIFLFDQNGRRVKSWYNYKLTNLQNPNVLLVLIMSLMHNWYLKLSSIRHIIISIKSLNNFD